MKAGVWLDNHKAFVVYLDNGKETLLRLDSEVEDYHPRGGSRTSAPYASHDAISESRLLARRKLQLQRYYNAILAKIKSCDAFYLFGPAGAKTGLEKAISNDPKLKPKLAKVEAADSMTENQIVAQTRAFYNE